MSVMRFRKSLRDDPASQPSDVVSGAGAAPSITPGTDTTKTPAKFGRTLLIHGYSATGVDFFFWRDMLESVGISTHSIEIGNYVTLNNEVTIKDLGEAFDRALRYAPWSSGDPDDIWTFDAIVHSTGMLVLRQWLTSDPYERADPRSRIKRLKHLVGLAPATFGSPQAKQGRSWLGALVKGSRQLGPDFLNAGNQVLDGLELASKYTWDLAHKDMLCPNPLYDKGSDTPYVTVFIGNKPYDGVAAVSNSPGSDGTVRWAGCALNTRKVSIDFRREPKLRDANDNVTRCRLDPWVSGRLAAPMIAVDGLNHGTIIRNPDPTVADLIKKFFDLSDADAYKLWQKEALAFGENGLPTMAQESIKGAFGGAGWQQLLVHVVDDHGDGVPDYNLQLFVGQALTDSDDPNFVPVPVQVDTYTRDASYRCFYIRLSDEMLNLNTSEATSKKMWLELIASSGSELIEYEAYTDIDGDPKRLTIDHLGGGPAKLDITGLAQGDSTLLYPYTTTLLEIFVEREPLPLDKASTIFTFLEKGPPPPNPAG